MTRPTNSRVKMKPVKAWAIALGDGITGHVGNGGLALDVYSDRESALRVVKGNDFLAARGSVVPVMIRAVPPARGGRKK